MVCDASRCKGNGKSHFLRDTISFREESESRLAIGSAESPSRDSDPSLSEASEDLSSFSEESESEDSDSSFSENMSLPGDVGEKVDKSRSSVSPTNDIDCEIEEEASIASFFFFTWGLRGESSGPWSHEPSPLLSEDGCTGEGWTVCILFAYSFEE
jgi:hypothetical protein